MDDRKTKLYRDQRDRLAREDQARRSSSIDREAAASPSNSSHGEIPGRGYTLSSPDPVVDSDEYHD